MGAHGKCQENNWFPRHLPPWDTMETHGYKHGYHVSPCVPWEPLENRGNDHKKTIFAYRLTWIPTELKGLPARTIEYHENQSHFLRGPWEPENRATGTRDATGLSSGSGGVL